MAVGGVLPEKAKDLQSDLARGRVPVQVLGCGCTSTIEKTPEWAKSLLLSQKSSVRLGKLEKVVKHHGQKPSDDSRISEKLFEGEQDFSLKVLHHLQNVASLKSSVRKVNIEAGMSLIKERNKFLVLADSFEWDVALCYAKEPLAEDSEDERRIRRAIKERKIRWDEGLKSKFSGRPVF